MSVRVELGPKSNLGRLNSAMKNIGRNVKNSAAVAVERIGAGIQGKVCQSVSTTLGFGFGSVSGFGFGSFRLGGRLCLLRVV